MPLPDGMTTLLHQNRLYTTTVACVNRTAEGPFDSTPEPSTFCTSLRRSQLFNAQREPPTKMDGSETGRHIARGTLKGSGPAKGEGYTFCNPSQMRTTEGSSFVKPSSSGSDISEVFCSARFLLPPVRVYDYGPWWNLGRMPCGGSVIFNSVS